MRYQVKNPICLILFNRPHTTKRVLKVISEVRPSKLYVIADGPRKGRPGEDKICQNTRDLIKNIGADTQVMTNFSETNLGCKSRLASGLKWLFEKEEQAIILEDDVLPSVSFFRFCDDLLEQYKDDTRVESICGCNGMDYRPKDGSYFFSHFSDIWGWATWKRAFKDYDEHLSSWPTDRKSPEAFKGLSAESWPDAKWHFDMVHRYNLDTWDYQWDYLRFKRGGLSIFPNQNLVTNIGFGHDGTHTREANHPMANLERHDMAFPLIHPKEVAVDLIYDEIHQKKWFSSSKMTLISAKIKQWIKQKMGLAALSRGRTYASD